MSVPIFKRLGEWIGPPKNDNFVGPKIVSNFDIFNVWHTWISLHNSNPTVLIKYFNTRLSFTV